MLAWRHATVARNPPDVQRRAARQVTCRGGSHPIHGSSVSGRGAQGTPTLSGLGPTEPEPYSSSSSSDAGVHAAVAQRLQEALGITRGQYYSYIQPRVAARSDEDGPWDVDPVLEVLLGLGGPDRIQSLVLSHPELLTVDELPAWLDFLARYGVRRDAFFTLLSTHTCLFTRPSALYYAGLSIMWLTGLGLTHRDLSRCVIPKCATLLGSDPQQHMRPVVDFLVQELGVSAPGHIVELVTRCPQLLALDVDGQLRPRVAYLESMGLSRDEVRTLAESVTSLLLSDPKPQLAPVLRFLTTTCCLDRRHAVQVLLSCPSAITLSELNLQRKWEFLVQEMGAGAEDLLAYPPYLASSLLNETGPRYFFARQVNALDRFRSSATAPKPGLAASSVCGCNTGPGSASDEARISLNTNRTSNNSSSGDSSSSTGGGSSASRELSAAGNFNSSSVYRVSNNARKGPGSGCGIQAGMGASEGTRVDTGAGSSGSTGASSDFGMCDSAAPNRPAMKRVELASLLGSDLASYLLRIGAEEEEYLEFRRHWQVFEGRRWSGMISVAPWEEASW